MHFADLRNAILKRLEFYPNKKCKKRERERLKHCGGEGNREYFFKATRYGTTTLTVITKTFAGRVYKY